MCLVYNRGPQRPFLENPHSQMFLSAVVSSLLCTTNQLLWLYNFMLSVSILKLQFILVCGQILV